MELRKNYSDNVLDDVNIDNLEEWINQNTNDEDVLMFMSAGPLSDIARKIAGL